MLYQVSKSPKGDQNVHIAEMLDALLKAITIESADGKRELPDMLATTGGDPHTSTETIRRDGVEFTVYKSIKVVAPNSVVYEGQELKHVTD